MRAIGAAFRFAFMMVVAALMVSCEGGDSTNWTDVGTLYARANAQEGTRYNVTESGRYSFLIEGGAYSTGPGGSSGWLTQVWIFKNRAVQWYEVEANPPAVNADGRVGSTATHSTAEEAEAAGVGSSLSMELAAGDYLLFVVPDNRGWFGDNPGGVSFTVRKAAQ
jgi:hypothetical protein